MSFLTRIGIGSATIDLIPEETTVQPGDEIDAHLELIGGSSVQTVDDVEIALITRYQYEGAEGNTFWRQHGLWTTEFKEGFSVQPEDDREVDVPPIKVPPSTPATLDTTTVWIQSALDINWAVDPSDVDQLEVRPTPRMQAVLDALEDQLEFRLREVKNVEADTHLTPHPFVQKYTFSSGQGPFADALDALSVAPIQTEDRDELVLLFQVDRLGDLEVGDEREGRLSVDEADPSTLADRLHDEVRQRL